MHCMKTAFLSNKIQYICISLLLWTMHINTISDFIRSTHLIISWFIMIYRDLSWFIMIYHDMSWYFLINHDISRCIMIYHDLSRYIMISHCFGWSQWRMSLSHRFLSNKSPHRKVCIISAALNRSILRLPQTVDAQEEREEADGKRHIWTKQCPVLLFSIQTLGQG